MGQIDCHDRMRESDLKSLKRVDECPSHDPYPGGTENAVRGKNKVEKQPAVASQQCVGTKKKGMKVNGMQCMSGEKKRTAETRGCMSHDECHVRNGGSYRVVWR